MNPANIPCLVIVSFESFVAFIVWNAEVVNNVWDVLRFIHSGRHRSRFSLTWTLWVHMLTFSLWRCCSPTLPLHYTVLTKRRNRLEHRSLTPATWNRGRYFNSSSSGNTAVHCHGIRAKSEDGGWVPRGLPEGRLGMESLQKNSNYPNTIL